MAFQKDPSDLYEPAGFRMEETDWIDRTLDRRDSRPRERPYVRGEREQPPGSGRCHSVLGSQAENAPGQNAVGITDRGGDETGDRSFRRQR
jgi:hypothetical protein